MADRVVMLEAVMLPKDTKALPVQCLDCGSTLRVAIPVSISDLATILDAYSNAHAECRLDRKEREAH